ncbi:Twin-arginine translocation pathway signal [Labilithrix luteola]|uniref:Twin-arginine translocation pathway signal n=1 Tax=Labilithrix luteola TaxID=1391654 RepID=A0A0K1QA58_9BACT|nr:LamG domain-containing protein [Labilithrix luteola]AKV02618.1 Twin-arginine translocation pathway signal [Labilithrix luteola]
MSIADGRRSRDEKRIERVCVLSKGMTHAARPPPLRAILCGCVLVVSSPACSSGPIALGRLDDTTFGADAGLGDGGLGGEAPSDAAVDAVADGGVCDTPVPTRQYAFDGTGTEVVDTRGGPSAKLLGGATLDGSGVVHLDGVDDYVDLPNGLLAGASELTIAAWFRRIGGPSAYKRVFDIGTTGNGEDPPIGESTTGKAYLALSTATGYPQSGLAALMTAGGPPGEIAATSDVVLDKEMHLAVVVVSNAALSLYYDAALVAQVTRTVELSSILDENAWLGRSQYSADGFLEGDYADVRFFSGALTACHVQKLFAQGQDPH